MPTPRRFRELFALTNNPSGFVRRHKVADERLAAGLLFHALYHRARVLLRQTHRASLRGRTPGELADELARLAADIGQPRWAELIDQLRKPDGFLSPKVADALDRAEIPPAHWRRTERFLREWPTLRAASEGYIRAFVAWVQSDAFSRAFMGGWRFPRSVEVPGATPSTAEEVKARAGDVAQSDRMIADPDRAIADATDYLEPLIPTEDELARAPLAVCPICDRVYLRSASKHAQRYCPVCRSKWTPTQLWWRSRKTLTPSRAARKRKGGHR